MIDNLRSRWQAGSGRQPSPLESDAPAWLASLAVHLALLVALASCWMWIPLERPVFLSASPIDPDDQPVPEEFRFSVEPQADVGALGDGGSDPARPAALVRARDSHIAYEFVPTAPVGEIRAPELDRTMLAGPQVTENLLIKGAGSVGVSGAAGAIDRITHEILLSLDQRPIA